jgi:hypothetical protein
MKKWRLAALQTYFMIGLQATGCLHSEGIVKIKYLQLKQSLELGCKTDVQS